MIDRSIGTQTSESGVCISDTVRDQAQTQQPLKRSSSEEINKRREKAQNESHQEEKENSE